MPHGLPECFACLLNGKKWQVMWSITSKQTCSCQQRLLSPDHSLGGFFERLSLDNNNLGFWRAKFWATNLICLSLQYLLGFKPPLSLFVILSSHNIFGIPWKKSSSRDRMNALSSEITAHWAPHWAHDTRAFYKGQNVETKRRQNKGRMERSKLAKKMESVEQKAEIDKSWGWRERMKSFEQFLPAARFDAALNASSMTGHLPNRLDVRKSAKSLKKKRIFKTFISENPFSQLWKSFLTQGL